jgi:hypothetical protein
VKATTTVRFALFPGAGGGDEMEAWILFIKKRFRMTMRFEDYFTYSPPPEKNPS